MFSKNIFVREAEVIYQCEHFLNIQEIFCRQILIDSHVEMKRHFCKHDMNFMNSGVNKITIALISNLCM